MIADAVDLSKYKSSLVKGKGSPVRLISIMEDKTLIACAAIVAIATPSVPILNIFTRIISPKIFAAQAMATKRSGAFEFPIPLKTALITL